MTFFKGLKESITVRLVVVGFLILAMLVPLMMVTNTIESRSTYYDVAVSSIKDGWANTQTFGGPFLVIPYSYKEEVKTFNKETEKYETSLAERTERFYVVPETAHTVTKFTTETRKRGMFDVPIYTGALSISGTIRVPSLVNTLPADQLAGLQIQKPYLGLIVSDPRGIFGDIALNLDGTALELKPGTMLAQVEGIHAPLETVLQTGVEQSLAYDIALQLKGTQAFSYIPLARQADLKMEANWPHPSFGGRFLPATHTITGEGFTAAWSVGALATNIEQKFNECAAGSSCDALYTTNIDASFFESINLYAMVLRSAKYGILFLGLTFMTFFMFEVFRRFRIHPLQYFMVGGALSIFYLLLLALAEHIGFGPAYAAASLSVCALLGYYVAHIVRSTRVGGLFGGSILALYGLLFVILRSEDYALLMGTGLLFALLAGAMILTRKVDWYAIGREKGRE